MQGSRKRSTEGEARGKYFREAKKSIRLMSSKKGAGGLGGSGSCLRGNWNLPGWGDRRPDGLAFGLTRWWIFIFKRILSPRNQEP